ncbi:MAG: hypothetical protein J6S51_04920 [Kiritimatiellae bacterium]|nr:hypothetical protein [Kiritimatiellia bacterium]
MAIKLLVVAFVSGIISFASPVFADTYTWALKNAETGALKDGTFATAANWTLSDGTVATEAPGVDDDVIIPSGTAAYTVTASSKFNVKSLTIGDNEDASAVVTLKLNVQITKDNFVGDIVNDIVVGAKGKITHTPLATTNTGTAAIGKTDYKLNLKAGGNITIKDGGVVNANGCGFAAGKGPYPGKTYGNDYRGSSHGGVGTQGSGAANHTLNAYGYIRNPVEGGSGSGAAGGGVIYLSAEGLISLMGTITANASSSGNGAGGSIIVKGGALSGTGIVSTVGGTGTSYPGGGGGRIAIYTKEQKEFSEVPFSAKVTAACGQTGKGSCGTIYFESAKHESGRGDLIIDGKSQTSKKYTYIKTNVTDAEQPFGKLIVKGGAYVSINDFSITLTRGLDIENSTSISTAKRNNGTKVGGIIISPEPGDVFEYTYTDANTVLTLDSLVCNTPEGATIKLKNSSTIAIAANGKLELNGAENNLLKLKPATDDGIWTLKVNSGVAMSINYVDVLKCKASGVAIIADNSNGDDYSKENNWSFPVPAKPGDPLTWTGAKDTSWRNADNWLDQYGGVRLPLETDVIIIPSGCANYPNIIAETKVNTLITEQGASIKLSAVNLIVTNNLSLAGAMTRTNTEKLIIEGQGDATLDFGNGEYGDILITKSGGTVTLPNGLIAKRLKVLSSSVTSFIMPTGKTIEADVFDIDGANGDYANKLITLTSSSLGEKWGLKVNGVMRVRGVAVSNSNASLGLMIAAGDFATDSGGNINWNFTSGSAVEWVGGVDTSWSTPENWLPVGVPGEDAIVAICPKTSSASVVLNSDEAIVSLGGLIIGGTDYVASLQCNKAIETKNALDVSEKATLILNSIATDNIINLFAIVRPTATITHDGPRSANTQSCGVNLYIKGDFTVEKGASINVNGKGFAAGYGPAKGSGQGDSTISPSHGAIGYLQSVSSCYGSILNPVTFGSPYIQGAGGGQIKIIADGDLTNNGTISANGGTGKGGAGGSIIISAAALVGSGSITADCKSSEYGGAGGRVAIYQTEATSLSFAGGISVAHYYNGTRYSGTGTKYYQFANSEEGGGTIYFAPGSNAGTSFPMSADGPAKSAYAKATVDLSSGTLYLLADTKVYDLNIRGGKINLQGHTLRVMSKKHKDGNGWGGSYANLVVEGGGKIIWPAGMSLVIR